MPPRICYTVRFEGCFRPALLVGAARRSGIVPRNATSRSSPPRRVLLLATDIEFRFSPGSTFSGMKGHIHTKGNRYYVVVDIGRHPEAGRRQQKWYSAGRTKREAERKQADVLAGQRTGYHGPETGGPKF